MTRPIPQLLLPWPDLYPQPAFGNPMTDQSPTRQFTASSFLDGVTADRIDRLAASHTKHRSSSLSQCATSFRAVSEGNANMIGLGGFL
jgi:hypothetical protein